jgi:subtilisin family serine protease
VSLGLITALWPNPAGPPPTPQSALEKVQQQSASPDAVNVVDLSRLDRQPGDPGPATRAGRAEPLPQIEAEQPDPRPATVVAAGQQTADARPTLGLVPRQPGQDAAADPSESDRETEPDITQPGFEKLDTALRGLVAGDPAAPVRVIIQTRPGEQTATAAWLAGEDRQVHRVHPGIGGVTATLSASDVSALASGQTIRRISIDAIVRPTNELVRPTLGLLPGGGVVGGGSLWAGDTATVAVVDSGIASSQDLPPDRIVNFYDFT